MRDSCAPLLPKLIISSRHRSKHLGNKRKETPGWGREEGGGVRCVWIYAPVTFENVFFPCLKSYMSFCLQFTYKTNPRVRPPPLPTLSPLSLPLTCGVLKEEWVVGWFSVLESSFRARREEVRTTFASNPVEVSIAAARQGRDALPATEDTH